MGLDGTALLTAPYTERRARLESLAGFQLTPSFVADTPDEWVAQSARAAEPPGSLRLARPAPGSPPRGGQASLAAGIVAESQPGRVHRRSQVANGVGPDSV
jgi:hypothetical protein